MTFEGEYLIPQVDTSFDADFLGQMFDRQDVTCFVRW